MTEKQPSKPPKRPTRKGEVVDLGRELNGYTDRDGNPAKQDRREKGLL